MPDSTVLKIWSPRTPYSTDPIEYDALSHHICFRSVYSSLVSDYNLGQVQGVIAESWSNNPDKSTWTFSIRQNLKFQNSEPIQARDVALSLNRAALMMKKRNSKSGMLEFLIGFDNIQYANELIPGVEVSDNNVVLKFTQPIPDLLNKISFGLYAIVHRSEFDSSTGAWKDNRKISASGPYELLEWENEKITLRLRPDFPKELLLAKPIKLAELYFSKEHLADADIIIDFDDSLAIPEGFQFFGPVKSAIRYIECEGWNKADSPCATLSSRLQMRQEFYRFLNELKFPVVQSFFPMAIQGVNELSLINTPVSNNGLNGKLLKASEIVSALKSDQNAERLTTQEAYQSAIKQIGNRFGMTIQFMTPPKNAPIPNDADIRFRMTAILVDSPHHDIQFMFLSDHGVRLPDFNGEIKKYVKPNDFSVQKVNELLWDQGIIWPIGHMALGLWKKDNNISLKSYNLVLPPLDLQWIERR